MKKFISALVIATVGLFGVVGCGDKPTVESVMRDGGAVHKENSFSFTTVEEQRNQGRSNASASAAEYQRQNPRISGWDTIVKADTTHSATCPQGDGWSEVVFMRTEREEGKTKNLQIEKASVMCSTVSTAQGCVMFAPTDNWSKHPAKGKDGSCQSTLEVPFPLPKVAGAKN